MPRPIGDDVERVEINRYVWQGLDFRIHVTVYPIRPTGLPLTCGTRASTITPAFVPRALTVNLRGRDAAAHEGADQARELRKAMTGVWERRRQLRAVSQ